MSHPQTTTHSRRALRLLLLCVVGLVASLFVVALSEGSLRRSTRGIGPPLPDPIDGADVSPFCVNVALQTSLAAEDLRHTLDRIDDAGFVWLRQTFPWAAIEPTPGTYQWEPWDTLIAAISRHPADLQIIAVLDTAPTWATGNPAGPWTDNPVGPWTDNPVGPWTDNPVGPWDVAPPTDPADLTRFAGAFAARYGDRIDHYQIWDEPNLSSHWGGRDVEPATYAALLEAAAEAIRAADPDGAATILLAGLAPTVETGPRNLSDVRYLSALYTLGADAHFDVVAGKPYGFDTGPDDRRIDESTLNFSRFVLLREEMVAQGDGDKALWASHWGWNALPPGWEGQPSIWGRTDEATQATYTVATLARARQEWPWAGALCLENWQPDAPPDDPRWGFALVDRDGAPRPIYQAIRGFTSTPPTNAPGYHAATSGVADYGGAWRFSDLGADVTEAGGQRVTIPFEGTDFGLRVRKGNYRAFFFVTVDGRPANALPQDENGAYLVLSSPDNQPQVTTVAVAQGLEGGPHVAQVTVERGWGQWPLVGWSVGWWPHAEARGHRRLQMALGGAALVCAAGIVWSARRVRWRWAGTALGALWRRLSNGTQIAITATVTLVFWASAWLTWGQERLAGGSGLVATLAAATLYYVSPIFILSILSLGLLGLLILLRLDLGLALVALAAPFYLQSRPMFDRAFSVVEIAVLLCFVSWIVQRGLKFARDRRAGTEGGTRFALYGPRLALDWAVLFFVAASCASIFVADIRGVALREFRIMILEPALFYLMLRTTPLDQSARWRIVDGFVLGAVGVALIGLYQYLFTADVITAEAGLRRLNSVYGSPNNVGLYLGRVFPLLIAVAFLPSTSRRGELVEPSGRSPSTSRRGELVEPPECQARYRRLGYGIAALVVGAAILLSFSKGALLFGVPASLLAMGLLAGGRWIWAALGTLGAAVLAAIPLLRTPRFTSIFDLQSGTSFFRLHLWRSTLDMIRDHPWLGVGLDNFLYAYRGRYIRPAAWQEPNLSHPHNIVLDYWSRIGLLGLAAGVWLQVAFWRLALPLRRLARADERALAIGLMGSMVDLTAHGLVDNSYFVVDLAFAFFVTLAMVAHLAQRQSNPETL